MRIRDIMEAPIGDYVQLGTQMGSPKMKGFKKKPIEAKVREVFDKIDLVVNVYSLAVENLPELSVRELGIEKLNFSDSKSFNPDFYVETSIEKLSQVLDPKLLKPIKVNSNEVSVIVVVSEDGDDNFKATPWSIVHDIVHGFSLTKKDVARRLDKIEDSINTFDRKWKRTIRAQEKSPSFSGIHDLMTMKSARSGGLHDRPEERTTELITQWIFSGDIKFDTGMLNGVLSPADQTELNKDLLRVKKSVVSNFKWILANVRGRLLLTSM